VTIERLRAAAEQHVGAVLTQRMFETHEPLQVHRDIQAAAYAALA